MRVLVLARANYVLAARRVDLLREGGHSVKFLSLHTEGALTDAEGLPHFGSMPVRFAASFPVIKAKIRQFRPDLIDAHGATSYGFLAALSSGRVPLLLTLYGTDLYDHSVGSRMFTTMASVALSRANLIYGSSSAILDHAGPFYEQLDSKRSVFLPWGIPLGEPVPRAAAEGVRQSLGTSQEAFVAIHPRRLAPHWRIDWILDRLEEFGKMTGRRVELWLAYPPPTRAEEGVLDEIRDQAMEQDVVVRELGPLSHRRLMEHLAAADAFVCAAPAEMLANSFLEAMYHGATPVVTRVPAFEEASMWCGATVRMVDPDDAKGYCKELAVVSGYNASAKERIDIGNREAVKKYADDRECLRQLLAIATERLGL